MLLAALMLGQAVAPPPSEDEIVVLGRRMRMIEIDMKAPRRNGRLVLERCRVTRGSGNAELDAVGCQAAQSCIADAPANRRALEACVGERSQPLLDAIVARWRAERAG